MSKNHPAEPTDLPSREREQTVTAVEALDILGWLVVQQQITETLKTCLSTDSVLPDRLNFPIKNVSFAQHNGFKKVLNWNVFE